MLRANHLAIRVRNGPISCAKGRLYALLSSIAFGYRIAISALLRIAVSPISFLTRTADPSPVSSVFGYGAHTSVALRLLEPYAIANRTHGIPTFRRLCWKTVSGYSSALYLSHPPWVFRLPQLDVCVSFPRLFSLDPPLVLL